MSMFNGLSDALVNVLDTELRFTFPELHILFECLDRNEIWLEDLEKGNAKNNWLSLDGRLYSAVLADIKEKLLSYHFH